MVTLMKKINKITYKSMQDVRLNLPPPFYTTISTCPFKIKYKIFTE